MTKKQIDNILFGIGVDSLNRFETFLNLMPKVKGKGYWYALRNSYDMSDNLFRFKGLVRSAFLKDESDREYLMTKSERNYFRNLPERLTIYRGMTQKEQKTKSFGVSWTLKKEVAEFFAFKYKRNYHTNHLKKVVCQKKIAKADVIAFINDRKEYEIIYVGH